MTGKEFMRALANGEADIVQVLLDLLARTNASYCVVGGLAVNAYAEPVVSLDLDIVVIAGDTEAVCEQARQQGMKVERFPHSIILTSPRSDLRVQLRTDERYQVFVARATGLVGRRWVQDLGECDSDGEQWQKCARKCVV